MSSASFHIRPMSAEEVPLAIEWAANEGWNPGLNDAACYHRADPQGFLLGLVGDQPVGCISAIRYDDSFGFIGFYIVKTAFRGQGYGIQLWNTAMKYLQGCNIGLDGVVEQQANYQQSGFQLAHRNIRYQGPGGTSPVATNVIPLDSRPFAEIAAYDADFFPADRAAFIQGWIEQPGAVALGAIQGGHLAGYGMIRPSQDGWKIGPLFADTPELADALFLALKSACPVTDTLFLDVPEENMAALALVERHNMTPVFETARMYTQERPLLPMQRWFGVTSFEIG